MENSSFVYEPLTLQEGEIRLLQVSTRHDENQPIFCQMEHALLSRRFTALSYTWGSPMPLYTIYVNGRTFSVRQNLYDFLGTISQTASYEDQWIWIDQICINQENMPERNQQVAQMGDLYRNADEVVAWLGRNVASSDYWLDLINSNRMPKFIQVNKILPFCNQLFSNPYWCRVWITQEVILSRKLTILVGNIGVEVGTLCQYLENWHISMAAEGDTHAQLAIKRAINLFHCRSSRSKTGLDWPSAIALEEFAKCQENLDYVYGVNGLVAKEYAVEVDYETNPSRLFFLVLNASYKSFSTLRNWPGPHRSNAPDERSLGMEFHSFLQHLQKLLKLEDDQDVAAFLHWSIQEQSLLRDNKYALDIEHMIRRSEVHQSVPIDEDMEDDRIVRTIKWRAWLDNLTSTN